MKNYTVFESEIDKIFVISDKGRISSLLLGEEDFEMFEKSEKHLYFIPSEPILVEAKKQLIEYFSGNRIIFDLPLEVKGTDFQKNVWQALMHIPYGETRSYQDIAVGIQNPKAVRAIGQANKANRIPIVIPCHRVIGKNQALTGYAGSRTDIKEKLLRIEGATYKGSKKI